MNKEIRELIKKTVGGREDKDWFIELEKGIESMIRKALQQERERIIKMFEDFDDMRAAQAVKDDIKTLNQ